MEILGMFGKRNPANQRFLKKCFLKAARGLSTSCVPFGNSGTDL